VYRQLFFAAVEDFISCKLQTVLNLKCAQINGYFKRAHAQSVLNAIGTYFIILEDLLMIEIYVCLCNRFMIGNSVLQIPYLVCSIIQIESLIVLCTNDRAVYFFRNQSNTVGDVSLQGIYFN